MASPLHARGIARYGLDRNPYIPRPLALLENQADARLLLEDLVGDLRSAREYVERAAQVPEPAFVLVTGGGGTGRTTVCNHLLACYRDARGIAREKFVVPDVEYKGRDPHALLLQWMNMLYWALRPGKFVLQEAGMDIDDALQNGTGLDSPITYEGNARNVLSNAARILDQAHGAAFATRLENVEGEDVVNAMLKVFESTPTLIVLTPHAQESNRGAVESAFRARPAKGTAPREANYPVVSLGTLAGQQAKRLIETHWEAATASDVPFAAAGVVKAFDAKARPPGRVLELTAGVLETKAHSLPSGTVWPDGRSELEIVEDAFVDLLKFIESKPWVRYA